MAETEAQDVDQKPKRQTRARKAAENEASPLTVGAYSAAGARSGEVRLPESIFGAEPNVAVMHPA